MTETTKTKARPLGIGGWITLVVLGSFLGVAVWFAINAWNKMAGVTMSLNGHIAMILGIVFATLVGIILMGLVFWSNRKGYDL